MHVASLDQTNVCLRQGHSQELLGELEFRMVFLVYCPGQNVFKIALWALTGAAGRMYHRLFALLSSCEGLKRIRIHHNEMIACIKRVRICSFCFHRKLKTPASLSEFCVFCF